MFHVEQTEPLRCLSSALSAAIERENISQRELARRCDVSPSTITQVIAGQRCTPELMGLLFAKISSDQRIGYELLLAHLRDEAMRAQIDLSHLVLKHADGVVLSELELSAEMNVNLGIIAKHVETMPELGDLIEDLAAMLLRFRGQVADLERQILAFPVAAAEAPRFPADHIGAQSRVKRSEGKRRSPAGNA